MPSIGQLCTILAFIFHCLLVLPVRTAERVASPVVSGPASIYRWDPVFTPQILGVVRPLALLVPVFAFSP